MKDLQITKLKLAPGDVVLVRPIYGRLNASQRERISTEMNVALPQNPVVVLDSDISVEVITP